MTNENLKKVRTLIQNNSTELIEEWKKFFDESQQEIQARYYDDFLGFFEECLDEDLVIKSDSVASMTMFLGKLYEILGEEYFFNFNNSVYTCYMKFPIFAILDKKGEFHYPVAKLLTAFFESMTSRMIIMIIKKNQELVRSTSFELEEREAPISEIYDGVLMITLVGTLDSNRMLKIIDKVLHKLEIADISDVIIEINSIYDINSEIAQQIMKLNSAIHFMGTNSYISGVNANIAKSLTHLGISLGDIRTFRSTKEAMLTIQRERQL
jgi:anti-anti-sigma regulatory factor